MRTWSIRLRNFIGLAIICTAVSCVTSERDAAKHLDMTSSIVREASNLLSADQELRRFPIEVDGFRGVMRLKGQVATPAQRTRAERMVWAVRGVKSVENDLNVTMAAGR